MTAQELYEALGKIPGEERERFRMIQWDDNRGEYAVKLKLSQTKHEEPSLTIIPEYFR